MVFKMMTSFIIIGIVLGFLAGTLGAMLGLGGSLFLVPVLLAIGIPSNYAVAAGLVCIIATSISASVVYLKAGWVNIRVAQRLQIGTVLGGATGAWVAPLLDPAIVNGLFSAVLLYAAWILWMRPAPAETASNAVLPDYQPRNVGIGAAACYAIGSVSGVLGIGGGPMQVPLMNLGMNLPLKAAAATSAFIMGVTATAAGVHYYLRGDMIPALVAPLTLGVLLGAQYGSRLAQRLRSRTLQRIFIVLLLALAAMLVNNVRGEY